MYNKENLCNLYKPSQLHKSCNSFLFQKYDTCAYKKEHCQYISQKYFITFIIQKEKDIDYKELPSKSTSDNELKIII